MKISEQRTAIIKEIGELEARAEKGENVTAKIRHCGKRLEELSKQRRKREDVMDANGPAFESKKGTLISRETLELAEANGIGRKALIHRINAGWDINRAVAMPLEKRTSAKELAVTIEKYKQLSGTGLKDVDVAEKIGITVRQLRRFKKDNGLTKVRKKVGVR